MLPGCATPAGTARFAARRIAGGASAEHFRVHRDLTLSSIGLGTYLGAEDEATDRACEAAMTLSLELGTNVVDSAVNYRAQRGERAVGRALAGAVARGETARDEILVATKGGYLPFDGGRPDDPAGYLRRAYLESGILRPEEIVAGCHSIAPRYLDDQLERSRRNLGLATLDVYYLHNPETQLEEVAPGEFLRRMRAAFEFLEARAAAGVIRFYGTATWDGYRGSPGSRGFMSLAELAGVAREVGGEGHHFRFVQLPYNLAMVEAYALRNQRVGGGAASLLEAARRLGIAVMASASIYQGHLARGLPPMLAEVLAGRRTDAGRALEFVRSTPGIAVALVGMKQRAHVEENLSLARVAPAQPEFLERLFMPPEPAS